MDAGTRPFKLNGSILVGWNHFSFTFYRYKTRVSGEHWGSRALVCGFNSLRPLGAVIVTLSESLPRGARRTSRTSLFGHRRPWRGLFNVLGGAVERLEKILPTFSFFLNGEDERKRFSLRAGGNKKAIRFIEAHRFRFSKTT